MSPHRDPEQVAARYLALAALVPLMLGLVFGEVALGMGGALLLLLMAAGTLVIGKTAGEGLGRLVSSHTSGSSTPPKKAWSHIEAMEARGEYARAAAAWRAEIVADPKDVDARLRLSDLLRTRLDDLAGATTVMREARDLAPAGDRRLGITLRLLDLYRADAAQDGRLVVELRRLLDERPGSPHASHWRAELAERIAARREPA